MKQYLEDLGWICSRCSGCPNKIADCASKEHKGVVISIVKYDRTRERFRIVKNSLIVAAGFGYELEGKMKENNLL